MARATWVDAKEYKQLDACRLSMQEVNLLTCSKQPRTPPRIICGRYQTCCSQTAQLLEKAGPVSVWPLTYITTRNPSLTSVRYGTGEDHPRIISSISPSQ